MFEHFSLIIPYRSDHGHRDTITEWVLDWWDRNAAGVELIVSDSDPNAPFSRSQARNRGADRATRPYFIVADSDSMVDDYWLRQACVQIMRDNELGIKNWILPYSIYYNLTQTFTEKILSEGEPVLLDPRNLEWDHRIPSATSPPAVSGINILPRGCYEVVNGYDERFTGWGYEDTAQALAYNVMWGQVHRLPGNCYHFWHPVTPGTTFDGPQIDSNRRLYERYFAAKSDVRRMAKTLEEKT